MELPSTDVDWDEDEDKEDVCSVPVPRISAAIIAAREAVGIGRFLDTEDAAGVASAPAEAPVLAVVAVRGVAAAAAAAAATGG